MSKDKYRECFDPLCCPVGFREHAKCYLYQRRVIGVGLFEYWWYTFKSLIGFNRDNGGDKL